MALHKAVCFMFLLLAVELTQQNPITIDASVRLKESDYRLINNEVLPENYNIQLTLLKDFHSEKKFTGIVEITLKLDTSKQAIESVEPITLNAKAIEIQAATLQDKDTPGELLLDNTEIPSDSNLERIEFKLAKDKKIEKGKTYILHIEYTAKLHEDMYGFYLSSYKLQNGDTEYLATTQFQPTHARRAFPCFDEPKYKATFDIKITHPVGYEALSNAEPKEKVEKDSTVTATFKTTPKMSTYIVAFMVTKFKGIYQYSKDVQSNWVWARSDLLQHGAYGHDIASKIIGDLDTFTGIKYLNSKINKLDQVAIPDFSAGAMENWGLVTYRESALLWDENESSLKSKQRVAAVIAHELAHMWFGNLVTCDWWSVTWLNEGFARYFQYFTTAKVENKWEMEKQFVIEQQRSIFLSDALEASVPLTSNDDAILTPAQISNKFSSISYNKGASVIRMMRNFLGEETFQKGLNQYLTANKEGNTKPDQLWTAFGSIPAGTLPADKTLKDVMDSWTTQAGYPVVKVEKADSSKVKLTQERFYFHKVTEETRADKDWYIPITYTNTKLLADEANPKKYWLETANSEVSDALKDSTWILLNVEDSGYYRVNYEDDLWNSLINNLLIEDNYNNIDSLSRAVLVDDALNLARAGLLKYKIALDVASYLKLETDYYPWYSAFNAFSFLRQRLDPSSEVYRLLNYFIRHLMDKLYTSASFEGIEKLGPIKVYGNNLALTWGCELGKKECTEKSEESLQALLDNGTPVHPDLRSVVYCYGVRESESGERWDFLRKRLSETQLPSEITTIISALGCSKDEAKLKTYLADSINPASGIRPQDAQSVYTAVITGSPEGVSVAFNFLKEKFTNIRDNYGGMNALSSVISATGDRLRTKTEIDAFKDFIDDKKEELGEASITGEQAVEKAEDNLKWVAEYYDDLETYLKENVPTTIAPLPTQGPGESTTPTTAPPPETTTAGGSAVSVCATILVFSVLKGVFRI